MFKVGDKVKIKSKGAIRASCVGNSDSYGITSSANGLYYNYRMDYESRSQLYIINKIDKQTGYIKFNGRNWTWIADWLVPYNNFLNNF